MLNLYVLTLAPLWIFLTSLSLGMFPIMTKLSLTHPFIRKTTEHIAKLWRKQMLYQCNVSKCGNLMDFNGNGPWCLTYLLFGLNKGHTPLTDVFSLIRAILVAFHVKAWWKFPGSMMRSADFAYATPQRSMLFTLTHHL